MKQWQRFFEGAWFFHSDFPQSGVVGAETQGQRNWQRFGATESVILGSDDVYKPYKLVILLCCNGYSKSFADAFVFANDTNSRAILG